MFLTLFVIGKAVLLSGLKEYTPEPADLTDKFPLFPLYQ